MQLAAQVLADVGHRCGYCRTDERLTDSLLSIEHILPVSAGGLTERTNLWHSCRECNERKGTQIQAVHPQGGATGHVVTFREEKVFLMLQYL